MTTCEPAAEAAEEPSGRSAVLSDKLIRRAFADRSVEQLYQRECQRSKQSDQDCFLAAVFLVAVHSVVSASLEDSGADADWWRGLGLLVVSSGVAVAQTFFWLHIRWRKKRRIINRRTSSASAASGASGENQLMTLAAWLLANVLILAVLQLAGFGRRAALSWSLLVNFLTCVTLPIRLATCLILTSAVSFLFLLVSAWNSYGQLYYYQQVAGEVILLLGAISLGVVASLIADYRQRRAFLDTRQSYEMRLTIEDQAREQEQLLLSVLPEHVAVKMRQDLGTAHDGQFKKIYMSRHENVSILFADIVGFTAISSTYPASELVHILNELFARFDRLSQRYNQMRIKILGDCYYCICGAPVERPDHAVLCVYMGLAMIDAIKCVRESTSSPVDMRVGIHTGAVLAGVLGQRQWQFDVYSQDVELANKMESSGVPGRVHVSSKTLSFLDNQFEVEPAHGEKREQILRTAGIETYFILRAKDPMNEPAEEQKTNLITKVETMATFNPDHEPEGLCCFQRCRVSSPVVTAESHQLLSNHSNNSGSDSRSDQTHILTQTFLDPVREGKYRQYYDSTAVYNLLALPLSLTWVTFFSFSTNQWSLVFLIFLPAIALLLFLVAVGVAGTCEWCAFVGLKTLSTRINENPLLRCSLVIFAVLLQVGVHLGGHVLNQSFPCPSEAILVMISVAMVPHLASCLKGTFLLFMSGLYSWKPWIQPEINIFCWFYRDEYSIDKVILLSCVLVLSSLTLFTLTRQLEATSRQLFLWQHQVEEQRERAADLRRRNQALLCNILPPHVAAHFLSAQRQIQQQQQQGEQLYSQSYTSVGVLFASIPNFSEFYSEETVNNQGLECLRFLNEVIFDFDALLDQSQFSDITKIKTIGSTYMAASGLNITEAPKDEDDVQNYWKHLSVLVEFALSMQRTLQSINDQSFNHFILRMGINHGPITAGVIGATKPHYDIWGNAVNVASRMESTGKAGCIQVTEETSGILRHFGYNFEQRGLVSVKGKGQLLTYYLIDSDSGG